jgi:hypothetical protein
VGRGGIGLLGGAVGVRWWRDAGVVREQSRG